LAVALGWSTGACHSLPDLVRDFSPEARSPSLSFPLQFTLKFIAIRADSYYTAPTSGRCSMGAGSDAGSASFRVSISYEEKN